LSSEVYDEILTQSNLYAEQQRAAKNDTSVWSPITKEELMVFIGVIVATGVVQLPSADDYWQSVLYLLTLGFRVCLPVFVFDRFSDICIWQTIQRDCRELILIFTKETCEMGNKGMGLC